MVLALEFLNIKLKSKLGLVALARTEARSLGPGVKDQPGNTMKSFLKTKDRISRVLWCRLNIPAFQGIPENVGLHIPGLAELQREFKTIPNILGRARLETRD